MEIFGNRENTEEGEISPHKRACVQPLRSAVEINQERANKTSC
jgi:hypothetical protein